MAEIVDGDLAEEFGQVTTLLRQLADRGEGTVLGLVPPGRSGVRRVSQAQAVCNEINRELRSIIPDRQTLVAEDDGEQGELPSGRPDVSAQVADVSAALWVHSLMITRRG
jgi:hypothetical protein